MEKKYAPRIYHFFHAASMVRPIIWIASYVALVPVFALIYWWLPDGQFRIPDGAGTDFGSWLYYSIVTITMTVEKGSVTVNGVSLTVCDSEADSFRVAIIPYTFEHTNFCRIEPGTVVNLEFDILGKYIARMRELL